MRKKKLAIIVFVFLFLLVIVALIYDSMYLEENADTQTPSPTPTSEVEDLKLDAEISFSPGYIHIKNIEDRDWSTCIYFFDNKFRYPLRKVDLIEDDYLGIYVKSGETVSLPADGFLTNEGLVFNASLAKPDYFLIECMEGRGRYYLE